MVSALALFLNLKIDLKEFSSAPPEGKCQKDITKSKEKWYEEKVVKSKKWKKVYDLLTQSRESRMKAK